MHQLDIFSDSRDRVLINRLGEALCAADIQLARHVADELALEFPADRHLASARLLIDAASHESAHRAVPFLDTAEAALARQTLVEKIVPAARQLLGADAAQGWLALRWQALARRATAVPFVAENSDVHAGELWLQGSAWAEAELAATAIESWRRKPAPLAWAAQARWHLQGMDAAWPLLAELAWLAPQRLAPLLQTLPDKSLRKLARGFEDSDLNAGDSVTTNAIDWRWWPAWLLVEQPLLATPLQAAVCDSDRPWVAGFSLVKNLLRAERQGRHHELMALRKQLQSLKPTLFVAYMSTR